MKKNAPPRFERRRAAQFAGELHERARSWVPQWGLADDERDFGRALLEIAARFNSEVAERLDNVGDKMKRGFFDWLGIRGKAARPARLPVAFKLSDAMQEAVPALAPVSLQVGVGSAQVMLETESDLSIVPGRLDAIVAVDPGIDAFYVQAPGITSLAPPEPVPTQWRLKSFTAGGATKLQVEPDSGLAQDMIVQIGNQQFRIVTADKDLVTIDPPLAGEGFPAQTVVRLVTTFVPFGGAARNQQMHALYIGDIDVLNVEAAATLEVFGGQALSDAEWQYWGKLGEGDVVDWWPLTKAVPQAQQPYALVLDKKRGAVEPRTIGASPSSRWIRAVKPTVPGSQPLLQVEALQLRVNCRPTPLSCDDADLRSVAAEGMANTTPLVLETVFYPLGREPRQFDAFYLGSAEAFSKRGAEALLCFELADTTFLSLVAVRNGQFSNRVLAGVGRDRALHLYAFNPFGGTLSQFREREPLRPPSPGLGGIAVPGPSVALDTMPGWRVPVWNRLGNLNPTDGFFVGTTAGDNVWAWYEDPVTASASGWTELGKLPPTTPGDPVAALVYLDDPAAPRLVALRDGQMSVCTWPGTQWNPVDTDDAANNVTVVLESLVPVLVETATGSFVTSVSAGLVGVSNTNEVYEVSATGACNRIASLAGSDVHVRPCAVRRGAARVIIAAQAGANSFAAVQLNPPLGPFNSPLEPTAKVKGFDAVINAGRLHFIISVDVDQDGYVASWSPFPAGAADPLFKTYIPPALGPLGGAPTVLPHQVVVPGEHADVLVADFDLSQRRTIVADIEPGLVVPVSAPSLVPGDTVIRMNALVPDAAKIADYGITREGEVFYPLDKSFALAASGPVLAYRSAQSLIGTIAATAPDLELDPADSDTADDSFILVDGQLRKVTLDETKTPPVAQLAPPLTGAATGTKFNYRYPIPTGGRPVPFLQLDPSGNGNWDAGLLTYASFVFAAPAVPQIQRAKAFRADAANHPIIVVLDSDWTTRPAPLAGATFVLDAVVSAWRRMLGDTSTNPELSWEYWNGKGWWNLDIDDGTKHLKSTGAVTFRVPADIASSDWAGKTNYWIRARLIGGDYGREQVTVLTTPAPGGGTKQTVERSTEGIHPPSVVRLRVSYRICENVTPALVLTHDNGSARDQSDANRTPGAIVEGFVPLVTLLERLQGTRPGAGADARSCAADCDCGASAATAAGGAQALPAAPGRAMFLGFSGKLSGGPVNVFLLVDEERPNDAFAPMAVSGLGADRFVPIVASDATRALGESGVLSMNFAVSPTPRELFGKSSSWVRLTPAATSSSDDWLPALRGAYVNAVWASARETLTLELLGSSEGAPKLTVTLARPPVLHDTLELRVREPLGEEEVRAFRDIDRDLVKDEIPNLPGSWVLWKQVVDPLDEGPADRVYSLDEATGEIRFGDGQRGMIPPVGRDSIVAFRYQRTEPGLASDTDVPGNRIAPRMPLNLVSPLESVELVVAADQAAGGAPPDTPERVLRFGAARMRNRERAVTAQDFEDLALESSPSIAQARCLVQPGRMRLVVVMQGKDPRPNAAQMRELERLLLNVAAPSLAATDALQVVKPRLRAIRVDLVLRVADLEHVGALGKRVKEAVGKLFDTATGGIDGCGWMLSATPREDDIALVLMDMADLQGIASVAFREVAADGTDKPFAGSVEQDELVVLAEEAIRLDFEVLETAV